MKNLKHHTRRQWIFITCAIALLAAVAVVPWRVVAQEGKSEPTVEAKTSTEPATKPKPTTEPAYLIFDLHHAKAEDVFNAIRVKYSNLFQEADEKQAVFSVSVNATGNQINAAIPPELREQVSTLVSDLEKQAETAAIAAGIKNKTPAELSKQLIGTWRGGYSDNDELIFKADGTFSQTIPDLRDVSKEANGNGIYQLRDLKSGTWKVEAGKLFFSDTGQPQLRGFPGNMPIPPGKLRPRECQLIRVDGSLLRLVPTLHCDGAAHSQIGTPPQMPMLFYRRVDPVNATGYGANIPADIKQLAAAAGLSADECKLFSGWVDENLDTKERHQLAIANRIIDAKAHKIDFQQLFGLTDEELAAYTDLLRSANSTQRTLVLASNLQLTDIELQAVEKLNHLASNIASIEHRLQAAVKQFPHGKTASGQNGPSDSSEAAEVPAELTALATTSTQIAQLRRWLIATVFTSPQ